MAEEQLAAIEASVLGSGYVKEGVSRPILRRLGTIARGEALSETAQHEATGDAGLMMLAAHNAALRRRGELPPPSCNAITARGTHCSREVGQPGVRCWQHGGS